MTLPAGVAYAEKGADIAVTQRGHWAPPYTSCMFAAKCMILGKMGYTMPLKRAANAYAGTPIVNFVLAQHRASGRPLSEGSTIYDGQLALAVLWKDEPSYPPVKYGVLGKDAVIDLLEQGATVRVTGGPMSAFPRKWNLPAGYGNSRHALVLDGTRLGPETGARQVHLVDPMLRPWTGYTGQWVNWNLLYKMPLDKDSLGRVIATWGMPDTALPVTDPSGDPEPTPPGEDAAGMPNITNYIAGYSARIMGGSRVRTAPTLKGTILRVTTTTESWPRVVGWVTGDKTLETDQWLVRWNNDRWEYTSKANVIGSPTAPASASDLQRLKQALDEDRADAARAKSYADRIVTRTT